MSERPVLLVVGGSGAIGSALAALALEQGWRVALHGRRAEPLAAVAEGLGEGVSIHPANFAVPAELPALIAEVLGRHGRLDALVDCSAAAPAGVTGPFALSDPAAYGELAALSVVAFQRLAHAALPALRVSRGALVALVSDAGVHAAAGQALIGAARAGTIGFVRNLALEIARDGVRINAIAPSFVEDTAVARMEGRVAARFERARQRAGLGLPDRFDVARLALFLAGPNSAKITGQVISINGGLNA